MLFGRRERRVKRILVVEDEPLVAFDNEHFLRDAGYEVAAAVDTEAGAVAAIGAEALDLVLSDVNLADGDGVAVAQAAARAGVPLLFVTATCPADAQDLAVGCLAKPYSQRDLLHSIQAVEAIIGGREPRRVPRGLTLFGRAA